MIVDSLFKKLILAISNMQLPDLTTSSTGTLSSWAIKPRTVNTTKPLKILVPSPTNVMINDVLKIKECDVRSCNRNPVMSISFIMLKCLGLTRKLNL